MLGEVPDLLRAAKDAATGATCDVAIDLDADGRIRADVTFGQDSIRLSWTLAAADMRGSGTLDLRMVAIESVSGARVRCPRGPLLCRTLTRAP